MSAVTRYALSPFSVTSSSLSLHPCVRGDPGLGCVWFASLSPCQHRIPAYYSPAVGASLLFQSGLHWEGNLFWEKGLQRNSKRLSLTGGEGNVNKGRNGIRKEPQCKNWIRSLKMRFVPRGYVYHFFLSPFCKPNLYWFKLMGDAAGWAEDELLLWRLLCLGNGAAQHKGGTLPSPLWPFKARIRGCVSRRAELWPPGEEGWCHAHGRTVWRPPSSSVQRLYWASHC